MDYEASATQRRKCRRAVLLGVCVLLLLTAVGACLGAAFGHRSSGPSNGNFRTILISKCKTYLGEKGEHSSENTCEEMWDAFSGAYVGKDPCDVPMEAYDPLIHAVSEKAACNRMLFWSKTKDIVHQLTEAKHCLLTLEDTLLGFVMDGLTWCGKNGSKETFTTGCPGWMECERNPVRSFWNRASAAFAESACGEVTAMLNGSINTPFNTNSIFGSIEVKKFSSPKMRALNVILVTRGNDTTNCENDSLQSLQGTLDPNLKYTCKEVQRSKILDCISDPDKPCGDCW
ncbi:ADP-ribosyl cyclase/cyclic ADP-ribose hydrolase 1-like [Anguilla rostrata]|uniref:ADP-ribosyl cyclase/cyclic ADP-ribose hydrolase 1-like n=1 Tax=Anguilla anguilla TaxID=7936 RepID=UPI0015B1CB06|nr:ADP-ribosyl cyclase/cyclic ADP-ribose hydrolase 1-like [Anguilla anguilla]